MIFYFSGNEEIDTLNRELRIKTMPLLQYIGIQLSKRAPITNLFGFDTDSVRK